MTNKTISFISIFISGVALITVGFFIFRNININLAGTEAASPPLTQKEIDYGNPGLCTTATSHTDDKGKTTYTYETHSEKNKVACYNTKNWSDWDGAGPGGQAHNNNNPGHDDSQHDPDQ